MKTAEQIAAGLSKECRKAVLDLPESSLGAALGLVEMGLADYETNYDDDMFFWLTDEGEAVRAILKEQADAK